MIANIWGSHTAPYGDFPYDKGSEFERALKDQWPAIRYFSFNTIDGADIFIDNNLVADMTLREILTKLRDAVNVAQKEVSWQIWEVAVPK